MPSPGELLEPNVDAWVYVYNHDAGDAPEVAGGDWITYLASRATTDPAHEHSRERR